MKLDPILGKANRLARSGKYEEAIKTLEPEINRYRGSFRYYYILGVCCLHTGDFGGALTYFRLASEVKIREPLAMLGMAVLYLRRGQTNRAVDYYLDVQDIDGKNRIAKRAMRVIKKYSGEDSLLNWLDSGKLKTLYPPIQFTGFSWKQISILASSAALAIIMFFGIMVKLKVMPNIFAGKSSRLQMSEFILNQEDRNQPVQTAGSYRYILTISQVLEVYEKALSLFTAYRDEAARINLNQIIESNASESIKNKSRLLISYMEIPGFDNYKHGDNVPYSDAIKDPPLYRNVHIIWKGMATNIQTIDEITHFDLLVGYDTRRNLEGIVRVEFNRALSISAERPLEVLGRIVPIGSSGADIMLEGIAIHQSGRLEAVPNK